MLHGGGARFCTLVVVIVFGTLYFTTLHSHSGEDAFSSAGLLEKAQNAVDPNPLARTGASSPREETMVQRLKHYDADVLTKVRERVVVCNGWSELTCILAVCRVCWYCDTRLRSYPAPV